MSIDVIVIILRKKEFQCLFRVIKNCQMFVCLKRCHVSFCAISKVAVGNVNQEGEKVGVAVDNLHIGSPVVDLVAPMEVDNAVNLSLSNGGMSPGDGEPSPGRCSTVELVNFRVN